MVKIPQDLLLSAIERSFLSLENPGFCLACGEEHDGCEPDATNYLCEYCGKHQVFGAEMILLMGEYE